MERLRRSWWPNETNIEVFVGVKLRSELAGISHLELPETAPGSECCLLVTFGPILEHMLARKLPPQPIVPVLLQAGKVLISVVTYRAEA